MSGYIGKHRGKFIKLENGDTLITYQGLKSITSAFEYDKKENIFYNFIIFIGPYCPLIVSIGICGLLYEFFTGK